MSPRASLTFALLLLWPTFVPAQPPAEPASRPAVSIPTPPPIADYETLVAGLADRDPAARGRARETLMLLRREDLPALREAAASALADGLPRAVRAQLRDVVVHVYLTGRHEFRGIPPSRMGVEPAGRNEPQIVRSCTPGYDGNRALRPGDLILGIGRFDSDGRPQPIVDVTTFDTLVAQVNSARVGDWVSVRILRNDEPLIVAVRLGPGASIDADNDRRQSLADGDRYWSHDFLPPLEAAIAAAKSAKTAPTTRPANGVNPSS